MSYTKYIAENNCEYLNAQTQTADNMLLKLVNVDCQKNNNNNNNLSKSSSNSNGLNIEGFSNGGNSDNSGIGHLPNGVCPDGHTFDGKGCRQICTHCTYRDNEPSSRSINEADICEPHGMFNGIDENGYVKCLSKNKDTDFYPVDFYSANAVLVTTNPILTSYTKRMY